MASHFGRELRKARLAAGRTQGDVAAVVGCSIPYVSDVERGRRDPVADDKIRRIAAFLGADPGTLFAAAVRDRGFATLGAGRNGSDSERVGSLLAVHWPALDDVALRSIEDLIRSGA